jgi:AcrR family transcriptional regulator
MNWMTSSSSETDPGGPCSPRRLGRPRDARADRAILEAALAIAARDGLEHLKVDDVAQLAGVSKATIYRRWASKEEMVAEACFAVSTVPVIPDTGSLRGDLKGIYQAMLKEIEGRNRKVILELISAKAKYPELHEVHQQFLEAKQRPLRTVLERAVERGELPADTDFALVSDLFHGPVIMRVALNGGSLDDATLERILDFVMAGLRAT